MAAHLLGFLAIALGASVPACAESGPTSLGPTEFNYIHIMNAPIAGASFSAAVSAWPAAGHPTPTFTGDIAFSDAFVYVIALPESDEIQLTLSLSTDGMTGACVMGITVILSATTTEPQTVPLSGTAEASMSASCADPIVLINSTVAGGSATVSLDVSPTSDTTGRVIAEIDVDGLALMALDGRQYQQGTLSFSASVDVERRRDGSLRSAGSEYQGPGGTSGSVKSTFSLPSGVSTLNCANPMPAGYQCLTNSGGTVPVKFNVSQFSNQWWVDMSSGICIYWSRGSGIGTMRAQGGVGSGGATTTYTSRFGVLLRANGTPIPDNANWYVVSIPDPGFIWDAQWQLLTFRPAGGAAPFIGQALARAPACPW